MLGRILEAFPLLFGKLGMVWILILWHWWAKELTSIFYREFDSKSETVIGNKDWCSLGLWYWASYFLLHFLMCHSTKISFLKWGYRSLSEVVCSYSFILHYCVLSGFIGNWPQLDTSCYFTCITFFFFFIMPEKTLFVERCSDNTWIFTFRILLVTGLHPTTVTSHILKVLQTQNGRIVIFIPLFRLNKSFIEEKTKIFILCRMCLV